MTSIHPRKPWLRLASACLVYAGLGLAGCSETAELPLQPESEASEAQLPFTSTPAAPQLLVAGLQGGSGSTVGPGGAIFVTEGAAGRVSRVDPETGAVTTFASGLPPSIIGVGGATDVAFVGSTAYVIVTLVASDVGGSDAVGVYRVDDPGSFTVIADIGAFNIANPTPGTFVPTGFLYSLEAFRGELLVADGHNNRVLHVTLDGEITPLISFGNVVPTGMDVVGNTIYLAEAGPIPHLPEDGRVVSFGPKSSTAHEIAAGGPLLVDVERGLGRTLFAVAQGTWDRVAEGSPALPNTGSLLKLDGAGGFVEVAQNLDRPTSLEIIRNTAYVVTLGGEVWTIDNISGPPFGPSP